jgi:membrane-bound inhibitor of C-type lysozyme
MRIMLSTLSLALVAGAASADVTVSIPLRIDMMDSVMSQTYSCSDGRVFDVQYVNAGANAFAIMDVDDAHRIFVNVVAGSGAKYVSGADVWWTKGDTATMENTLTDSGLLDCQAQKNPLSE